MGKALRQREAGEVMGGRTRQVRRLIQRVRQEGDRGLVHRWRGQSSNRRIAEQLKAKVLRLYEQRYADFGPTLAPEKLAERHGITLSAETLWTTTRVTGGGFQVRASSDSFLHRLDATSADTNNASSVAWPIPAPHNNNPPRLNPAAAREGPRPRTHCSICLVQ